MGLRPAFLALACLLNRVDARRSEYRKAQSDPGACLGADCAVRHRQQHEGLHRLESASSPFVPLDAPPTLLGEAAGEFSWDAVPVVGSDNERTGDSVSYLTRVLNQHIPQYCGSCWAHAALSALSDRIKIARKGSGADVQLSVQHVLNCGTAGTCNGGSQADVYSWMAEGSGGHPAGVAYESVNPYLACSGDTSEGICPAVDARTKAEAAQADAEATNIGHDLFGGVHEGRTRQVSGRKLSEHSEHSSVGAPGSGKCPPIAIARNCATFDEPCTALNHYPNASVGSYGVVHGEKAILEEVKRHGPVACSVDATNLDEYEGGIIDKPGPSSTDHVVSIVGYGSEGGVPYWKVRNSWGEAWGELGFFRVKRGGNQMNLEADCAWATPAAYTHANFPCAEDGANCLVPGAHVHHIAGQHPVLRGDVRKASALDAAPAAHALAPHPA